MRIASVLLVSAFGLASTALSAADYAIANAHSQVYFTVNHLGFSNSTGLLRVKEGTVSLNEKDWSKSRVEVILDVATLQMGDNTWNEHLAADKFFNTAKFPTARFVSTKVLKTGENTGTMVGNLTFLGTTKPVTLNIKTNKVGKNPMSNKDYAGFSATGSLKRSDFGLVAYPGAIGEEVSLRIEVEGEAVAK